MHAIEATLLEIVTNVYQALGWPGVVLLMTVETVAFPLPSELVMPLAGWLLVQDRGGSVWLVVLAGLCGALGNLLGSLFAYWVSLKGGRPLLHKYGRYVLVTDDEVDRAEAWFGKYGEWAVFFSRMVPVLRTVISVPAGIARMDLRKFSIYTFAGAFPWSLGLAYGGYLLGENWETLRATMRPFDIPILALLALGVAWFVVRRLRARARLRHSDPGDSPSQRPG